MHPVRFAVLASGGGSNLQALLEHIRSGDLPAQLTFVAGNNSRALALDRARQAGAPAYHVSERTEGSEDGVAAKLMELIERHPVDLLVLAGYMKKVPEALLRRLPNRVVNIHPALLPAFGGPGFYGHRVHEAVIRRGCQFTGITIHMVNEAYDAGQILWQRVVPVPGGVDADALARMVVAVEHASYWRVLRAFAAGDLVPTESSQPGEAVRIHPDWLRRMRALDAPAP